MILVKWPFKDLKNNIGCLCNCIIMVFVEICYLIQGLLSYSNLSINIYLPITVAVLLAVATVANFILAARKMHKRVKACFGQSK